MKITTELDALALHCREYLVSAGHSLAPDVMDDTNLSEICTKICAFMRGQGFEPAARESYGSFKMLIRANAHIQKLFTICLITSHTDSYPRIRKQYRFLWSMSSLPSQEGWA
jgi:hypothetical protein